jgi:hypothetical protein
LTPRAYAGRVAVLLSVAVLATGCSRDDDDAEPPTPSDPTETADTGTTTAPPDEQDASEDVTGFVCEPNDAGSWDASGVLTSSAPTPEDYAVTVLVTGPDETSAPGRRIVLRALEPGVATSFEVPDVRPVGAGDLTCQVRVLRLGG